MATSRTAQLAELAKEVQDFTDALVADGTLFGHSAEAVRLPATGRREAFRLREKSRGILEELALEAEAERAHSA